VDTGTKIDGVVDKSELLDENQKFPYEEGDTIELYVASRSSDEIRLSRTLSGIGGLRVIREAHRNSTPVEGTVKGVCKGGFHVEVMGKRAFCPISQIDLQYVESSDPYVGETYSFRITQFEEGGKNIVVSRRDLLSEEQEKSKKDFYAGISVNMQMEGRVTKLMPYGAFIELAPGVEGMVHLSEISWSRTERPEAILTIGDLVHVKIIGMEQGKRLGDLKLSLSMKQTTDDPWNSIGSHVSEGDKMTGKVTRCVKFGAFVEIAPGIEGLVHISEMSYRKRVLKPEDLVSEGDDVEVMVKSIDGENRRISLSMKEAEGDPWINILEKYKIGQLVQGTVDKKEHFGYFVSLEPGITGLLHKSKIETLNKPSSMEKISEGRKIPVIIEGIDPEERRITLIPGDTKDEEDWKSFARQPEQSMGSLGEKLKKALETKND
jgi:small subunit ribosomal protein S1